jgi:putative transposase
MTIEIQTQALERFRLIRQFLEDEVPLAELARHASVTERTLRRWVQRYQQDGIEGLVRKPRADKHTSSVLSAPLRQLAEGLALETPRRSIKTIHRMVCEVAQKLGERSPSYSTVYQLISSMDPALRMLAHEGSKTYSETYDLLYRREATSPNELWQADHTLLDIWVLDENDQPVKPWLTVIIDDYSRAVPGFFLSLQAPSAIQTALALRQGIWRKTEPGWPICGIPQVLYTDHGSDFTSQHIEQVCADLKIQMKFSIPGKPRGRGRIERFFETVNQRLLCMLPGYSPPGCADKKPVLTVPTLEQALKVFIIEQYHQESHSATGLTPLERWQEHGFLPQLPESLEKLDLLLLTVAKSRRVQQDGIRFQSLRYIDPLLAAYVGESVMVRYDPRDMAEIRVFYQNRFLCRAVCQELAGETVSLKDIIRARRQRQRDLRQIIDQRRSLVDQWFKIPGAANPSASEVRPERATQPEPTNKTTLKRYATD